MSDLCTVIPWVLERIVDDEYSVSRDSEGQIGSVNLDLSYGEAKKRFEVIERGLLASMPAENRAAFLTLKESYTHESLTAAMAKLFPGAGPRGAEQLAEQLGGATWEELVRWLDYIYEAAWEGPLLLSLSRGPWTRGGVGRNRTETGKNTRGFRDLQ